MTRFLTAITAAFALLISTIAPAAGGLGMTGDAPDDYFVNLNTVGQILCIDLPDGVTLQTDPATLTPAQMAEVKVFTGTGTIIARDRVLTAAHVVRGADMCAFQGKPMRIIYEDRRLDTAVAVVPLGDTPTTRINCDGFQAKQEYLAVGFAHGRDFALQRLSFDGAYGDVRLRDGSIAHHQALFGGTAHPGMSGGPVLNGAGEVVGIVNIGGSKSTGARDLTETPLCAALNWSSRP